MKFTTFKSGVAALASAATLLTAGGVMAEGEPQADAAEPTVSLDGLVAEDATGGALEDADLASLQVTKVQPVVFQSTDAQAEVDGLFGAAANLEEDASQKLRLNEAMPEVSVPEGFADEGFDFAGASTELDVVSLQYGFILASMPLLQAANPDAYKKMSGKLEQLAALNKAFAPGVATLLTSYTGSVKQGKPNAETLVKLLRATTQGMASAGDPAVERRHGYLLLGLWGGLITLSAESGKILPGLVSVGDSMIMMLEKDASFGGSDMQLAAKTKSVVALLKADTLDKAAVTKGVQSMLSVQADQK